MQPNSKRFKRWNGTELYYCYSRTYGRVGDFTDWNIRLIRLNGQIESLKKLSFDENKLTMGDLSKVVESPFFYLGDAQELQNLVEFTRNRIAVTAKEIEIIADVNCDPLTAVRVWLNGQHGISTREIDTLPTCRVLELLTLGNKKQPYLQSDRFTPRQLEIIKDSQSAWEKGRALILWHLNEIAARHGRPTIDEKLDRPTDPSKEFQIAMVRFQESTSILQIQYGQSFSDKVPWILGRDLFLLPSSTWDKVNEYLVFLEERANKYSNIEWKNTVIEPIRDHSYRWRETWRDLLQISQNDELTGSKASEKKPIDNKENCDLARALGASEAEVERLKNWVRTNLKGKELRVVELLLEAKGKIRIADLAIDEIIIQWDEPCVNAWNSTKLRLNKKLKKIKWNIMRHDGIARLNKC